jgi:hypothetical protein
VEPSIYDYLSKQTVAELTIANLNSATKLTNLDPVNIEFWQGVITLNRVLQDSRTFPHGLPIPETGTVHIETIADGANVAITPTGTEVWLILNVDLDSCSVGLKDADGNLNPLDLTLARPGTPLYLSSSMSLLFANGSGSQQTPSIAYFKVAL